ncbi:MAG: hypothetical protein KA536_21945 [Saprospiraceae bacterium]|nr:hypothetical protein [Saprospiraceae bacterium]
MTTLLEVLQQCTVEGLVVKIPTTPLDKKLYAQVKSAIEKIGGKWTGGKVFGFVFKTDPTELLADIAGGVKRNIKQEYQFFATPDALADDLVSIADIHEGDIILEPSAGQGAIIEAIRRFGIKAPVFYVEKMKENSDILLRKTTSSTDFKAYEIIVDDSDFLKMEVNEAFTKIIANPPFQNNQDISHVRHMYSLLKPKGRLVSLVIDNWDTADKKKKQFIQWLKDLDAEIIDVPAGAFKQSGTNVPTKIIIINKK